MRVLRSSRKRSHILVVEDDQDIRESLVEILVDDGYAASMANDGLQALLRLRNGLPKPDLILLDLMMPNMNGIEFRHELLNNPEYAGISVVVVTADANAKHTAEKLHVSAVIHKPLEIPALLELIAGILGC
jgi:CheY-like chemotaxis protein